VRVLIIDDHPLFREGLKSLLLTLDPATQVLQCARVPDAPALPDAQDIDLVLLDLNLPGPSRLEALATVRQHFEGACVVVVSADDDPATIEACIQAGAAGFIPKDSDPAATVQALRCVTGQGIYLPPKALAARAERAPLQAPPPRAPEAQAFSERQMAVLRSLLQGKSNKLIARDIGIAEGTVKAHLWAVYQRLGVSNRAQAMYRAHEMGLIGQLEQAPRPPRKKREW
jgi:DNA-binding NarL/FixJ family response regulator